MGVRDSHYLGCHVLALDLVKSWSFSRPSGAASTNMANTLLPPSPTSARAFAVSFALAAGTRRESKILIDMDMPTEPPTRRASPEPKVLDESEFEDGAKTSSRAKGESGLNELEHLEDEGDLLPRKAGLGSLIKNVKFDMGSLGS